MAFSRRLRRARHPGSERIKTHVENVRELDYRQNARIRRFPALDFTDRRHPYSALLCKGIDGELCILPRLAEAVTEHRHLLPYKHTASKNISQSRYFSIDDIS